MILGGWRAWVLFAFATLCPLRAAKYAGIGGLIDDPSGASVPGALISVVNEDTGFRRTANSLPDGSYSIPTLRPGPYKVSVRKDGFRTMIRFGVQLGENESARVDFHLVVGSVQETVTVEGGGNPRINRQDAAVGTLIEREFAERLPVSGSTILNLIALTPGVITTPATHGESGQFTVNGQRPNTHYFTVDGVSANSGVSAGGQPAQSTGGALPGMTAFGSMDSTLALEAVEDARVQTSTTTPEFGRLPGAQVALNSRSGGNELHGSVDYAFRDAALASNDWFANQARAAQSEQSLHNVGAGLGGPLWKNRTFFYASYNRLRFTQPVAGREPVPSAASRAGATFWAAPGLALYPPPTGGDLGGGAALWQGSVSRPSELDGGSLRLDQAIGPRVTVFGRYGGTASGTQFGNEPTDFLDVAARSGTGGVTVQAARWLTLDFRGNVARSENSSVWRAANSPPCALRALVQFFVAGSTGCDTLVRFAVGGMRTEFYGPEGQRRQTQAQLAQSALITLGGHTLRVGGDYRRLTPVRRDAAGTLSVIANRLGDLSDSGNLWTASSAAQRTQAVLEEGSVYAQDTWKISRVLTATLGLRWEFSPAPIPDSSAYYLDTTLGQAVQDRRPIWQSSYDNLAPRAGIAWRARPGLVVRVGGGVYYDSSLSLATDLVNDGPLNISQYGSARHAPFSAILRFGFLPDLRLPRVEQWNGSVEYALSGHDSLSAGYVGSRGERLVRREAGGLGSTDLIWLALATNHGESSYHALQLQYRRRLAGGLEALAGYGWSHSLDNSSTDGGLYWAGSGLAPTGDRGSSDFDVRQSLTAGFSYGWRRWNLDGTFRARTGFPIGVMAAEQYVGIRFENVYRPDLVGGQPAWLDDASAPNGRRLNPAAFQAKADGVQGNLGRNALTGFGMNQLDLSLRREFGTERRGVQLRLEAYNPLNRVNFADPVRFLASPLFGQSASQLNQMLGSGSPGSGLASLFQSGGPRSLQLSVRLRF